MFKSPFSSDFKIGILGGGQLGRMLHQASISLDLNIFFLDKNMNFPVGKTGGKVVQGDFQNYDDVYSFGKDKSVLSIEIENVNLDALLQLQKEGVIIHPNPEALAIIKDKGKQKLFYKKNNIPTSSFQLFENKNEVLKKIESGNLSLPFVQKTRLAGYDGNGVYVVKSDEDLSNLLEGPCLIEKKINIKKELSVIAARNATGAIQTFPLVEMTFHPTANLVEFLICPAEAPKRIQDKANNIAKELIQQFDISGLLAVEFFWTEEDEVLVNEVAPRPHNSGHHTIDSCVTSQFEQHLRGILNLPLGATNLISPAVMVNLLGEAGHSGSVALEGVEECFKIKGAKFHLYGKNSTRPFRKMGHATVLNDDLEQAKINARFIYNNFKIISQ